MRSPREQEMDIQDTIVLNNCRSGLGMKICGGLNERSKFTGIFVKKILFGGAVANDGRLQEGDQLLDANGKSLQNCSNDQAVGILRKAAQSGTARITFIRGGAARKKFEELFPDLNDSIASMVKKHSMNGSLSRSDSMSSRISTTSIEKRAWIYHGDRMSPAPLHESAGDGTYGSTNKPELTRMEALDLQLSPRGIDKPIQGHSNNINTIMTDAGRKGLLSTFDRTSSLDSGLPSSIRYSSPENTERGILQHSPIMNIEIPATTNLGISIAGGSNKQDGPHIYIKEVMEGCDAYVDGRLRKGDMIVSINGESMNDVTYEQARSALMRLKLKKDLTKYNVSYIVNTSNANNFQTNASLKSLQLPVQRIETLNRSPPQQSASQASPKNQGESVISQSSDEEALLKELMKMVENEDDYEKAEERISSLNIPRETVKTNGNSTNTYMGFSINDSVNYKEHQDLSPTHVEMSNFAPGLMSSPEERAAKQPFLGNGQSKSISHYLEQDINQSFTGGNQSGQSNRPRSVNRRNRNRRLSMDPSTSIRVEKLEAALSYLGFQVTPSEIRKVREKVRVNSGGSVTYGDFVNAARDVLDLRMDDRSKTLNASTLQFATRDIESIERAGTEKVDREKSNRIAEMNSIGRRSQEDLARVSRERDDALRELYYLRQEMSNKHRSEPAMEDELNRLRQENANANREIGELRIRTHLVSTALQEARQREQRFDQKTKDLEEELESAKSKSTNGGPKQQEFNELQKRLVVLGCQLRKSEVSKRIYEVAVEKLTKFAERVHDSVVDSRPATPASGRSSKMSKNDQPPSALMQEARDTIKAVKLLLEEEPLPFGWEEVYSPDGSRYYINHVTQTTSWLHPLSGIQHLKNAEDGKRPPMDMQL